MIRVMPTLEARPNDLREDVGVIVALSFTIALSYIGATPVRQGLDSIIDSRRSGGQCPLRRSLRCYPLVYYRRTRTTTRTIQPQARAGRSSTYSL